MPTTSTTTSNSSVNLFAKYATVFLILFAASTLISQSAMDFFAGLFSLSVLVLMVKDPEYRRRVLKRTGLEWIVVIWFVVTALSIGQGAGLVSNPQWTKLADFKWLILAFLIGRHLEFIRPHIAPLIRMGHVLSLCSLWAILIFFLRYNPLAPDHVMDVFPDGTVRTGGFLQQPIVFAQLYALWLMVYIGLIVQDLPAFRDLRHHPKQFLTISVAVLLTGTAILLSFTRGVWLAVPIALLVLVAIRKWWLALVTSMLGSGLLTLLMQIWPLFQARLVQAFQGGDQDRLWIWRANYQMFQDHPWLGVGYNHNVELLPIYYQRVGVPAGEHLISHAHNQFLHILSGTGLLGLSAYLTFWMFVLYRAIRTYQRSKQENLISGLALGLIGALLAFFLGGLFESNFEHAKIRSTLAIVLGLLLWIENRFPINKSSETNRRDRT